MTENDLKSLESELEKRGYRKWTTALAREYAEEIYPHEEGEDLGQMSFLRNNATKHISSTLKMLLRRYCLVDKSKVKNIYNGILVQLDPKNFGYSPYNQGRMDVIKSLFPDLGKEVEE